jgi:hypothetical protein
MMVFWFSELSVIFFFGSDRIYFSSVSDVEVKLRYHCHELTYLVNSNRRGVSFSIAALLLT